MAKSEGGRTTISWQPNGGTAFTEVAFVQDDLSPPGLSRNAIDSTTRDDTAYTRTFIKGWKDTGEASFNVAYDPSAATHGTAVGGLYAIWNDDTTGLDDWRITYPDASTETFQGIMTAFEPTAPLDDLMTADITIKASGTITWA